jgi:DNA polymerase III subunit delta'
MPDFIAIDRSELDEEADRFGDFPHPREMLAYHGPAEQELALLDAFRSGKLHHGWVFAGPEGVGKAVLAYRFARFLLANPDPDSPAVLAASDLSVRQDDPVTGRIARLAHADLAVMRRTQTKDGKSLRGQTAVEDVRDGLSVFRTTSAAGGWRIVIVDSADDLNASSANALLKMLEEPPERALFILISQRPGSLLPTIRSRCRLLRFNPLSAESVAKVLTGVSDADQAALLDAAQQSSGSVRNALALLDPGARAVRAAALKVIDAPIGGGKAAQALADSLNGKANANAFRGFLDLVEARLRAGVQSGGEGRALAARAELWEKLRRSAREVETFNLDRRPFILSVLSDLAEIERRAR